MSGIFVGGAILASAAVSYQQGKKAQKAAQQQFDQTMAAQTKAEDEAKAYDLQAGIDTATSETATTDYGVSNKKRKLQTANDLLVKPQGTTSNSLGIGFDY